MFQIKFIEEEIDEVELYKINLNWTIMYI